jgi:serine/tyrosine/threonine adenylyltransferase
MHLGLEHHYAQLPSEFFTDAVPATVATPQLFAWNEALAKELGLAATVRDAAHELFSGAQLPADARPIAMAYAGHQFAHFVPSLGDGRAMLLGELRNTAGELRDVHLKGAGRTSWSRSGDGLAALGPMLREFIISEAMDALGIPTTRSLAVITTGQQVFREDVLPGAILTRIASSHIRVGTFQYFAARGNHDAVRTLLNLCIDRHYPELKQSAEPALDFLRAVAARQAGLIAQWMSVGFIHGVMNTDNMAVSGETIDYGPCAFMDHYDPNTVFSSIDHRGRYAYANQPVAAQWNLARLAETLIPLIHADQSQAIADATAVIEPFIDQVDSLLLARMCRKLGLATTQPDDSTLIAALLSVMQHGHADFTLTLRHLAAAQTSDGEELFLQQFREPAAVTHWLSQWRQRLLQESLPATGRHQAMLAVNPAFIPRNHRVEAALNAASDRGDPEPFHTLLRLVQKPFDAHPEFAAFMAPPADSERVLQTFCGT